MFLTVYHEPILPSFAPRSDHAARRRTVNPAHARSLADLRAGVCRELAAVPAPLRLGHHEARFPRRIPDFTDVEVGWLDSAFLATYAIGQIPGGMAGDRFGPRAMLSILALVWSLATVGVAWTGGFWRLAGARGCLRPCPGRCLSRSQQDDATWFPLATRTSVQGMVTAMGRIGAAVRPVIIATFLMGRLDLSWQTALGDQHSGRHPGDRLLARACAIRPANIPGRTTAEQRLLCIPPSPADAPAMRSRRRAARSALPSQVRADAAMVTSASCSALR